ncbi:TIGR03986 family type III CRISPR-associated RAMP protein, partial [Chloroflexus sp.]|uniref:TIGR03986 family type III CRISPR-associated RAMP protein n=1 Tax=Chloroflexus sp. TaxID=1904827 RepID=UPI0040492B3D
EPIVPKILAGPKPTTFQHYLTQHAPDPQEQERDRNGNPKLVRERDDYTDPTKSVIRGHKLYWHKGPITVADVQEALDKLRNEHGREKEHDTQHTQMRPVAAGVRFRWRIHFENLSDEELGALLWALTLPGEPGKAYRHSIGMGKPYGMGAIKIDVNLLLENRKQRYAQLFDGENWQEGKTTATDRIPAFVDAFDLFIRSRIGAAQWKRLAEVERIQMLLRMLEWPGPDPALTRYMEIERQDPRIRRGKINEYKDRPVLPDPLHVDPAGRTRSSPAMRPPAAKGAELSQPASIDEVSEGMYLEGKVVRVETGRVVVEILGHEASITRDRLNPPARDLADMEARFPVGKTIRAWVVGFNKQGRLQLTMRKP